MSRINLLEIEYSEGVGIYGPAVLKNGQIVSQSVVAEDFGELQGKLEIAYKALQEIASISERSCEKYVSIADGIAVDALVRLETE